MRQADLNRSVAKATGETVQRIDRIGFNLVVMPRRQKPSRIGSRRKTKPRTASAR